MLQLKNFKSQCAFLMTSLADLLNKHTHTPPLFLIGGRTNTHSQVSKFVRIGFCSARQDKISLILCYTVKTKQHTQIQTNIGYLPTLKNIILQ